MQMKDKTKDWLIVATIFIVLGVSWYGVLSMLLSMSVTHNVIVLSIERE